MRHSAFNAVGMDSKAIKITSGGPDLAKENVHVMKPTSKLILEAASIFEQPLQVKCELLIFNEFEGELASQS